MDAREFCRKTFHETLDEMTDMPVELIRACHKHERAATFINNLAREFNKVPGKYKVSNLKIAVRDLTKMFVLAAKRHAEEMAMSDLEKLRIKTKASQDAELIKEADALIGGESEQTIQTKDGQISKGVIDNAV